MGGQSRRAARPRRSAGRAAGRRLDEQLVAAGRAGTQGHASPAAARSASASARRAASVARPSTGGAVTATTRAGPCGPSYRPPTRARRHRASPVTRCATARPVDRSAMPHCARTRHDPRRATGSRRPSGQTRRASASSALSGSHRPHGVKPSSTASPTGSGSFPGRAGARSRAGGSAAGRRSPARRSPSRATRAASAGETALRRRLVRRVLVVVLVVVVVGPDVVVVGREPACRPPTVGLPLWPAGPTRDAVAAGSAVPRPTAVSAAHAGSSWPATVAGRRPTRVPRCGRRARAAGPAGRRAVARGDPSGCSSRSHSRPLARRGRPARAAAAWRAPTTRATAASRLVRSSRPATRSIRRRGRARAGRPRRG